MIRGALQDCQGEFTLPAEVAEHIRAIQSAAFKNSGLTGTVEFSDDLFQIGSDAFIGCVDLTEVKFSNHASDLGDADPGLVLTRMPLQGQALQKLNSRKIFVL